MKIKWLVTDVAAVGSSGRMECAILWVTLAMYAISWPIQVTFLVAESLCDGGTSFRALITLLRFI